MRVVVLGPLLLLGALGLVAGQDLDDHDQPTAASPLGHQQQPVQGEPLELGSNVPEAVGISPQEGMAAPPFFGADLPQPPVAAAAPAEAPLADDSGYMADGFQADVGNPGSSSEPVSSARGEGSQETAAAQLLQGRYGQAMITLRGTHLSCTVTYPACHHVDDVHAPWHGFAIPAHPTVITACCNECMHEDDHGLRDVCALGVSEDSGIEHVRKLHCVAPRNHFGEL